MKHTHHLRRPSFHYPLIIVLTCTMMSSCVNNIPYDAEIGAPKLVLNALLLPDSMLTATVSRTVHFLDSEEPPRLTDATVTATINGEAYALTYDATTQRYLSPCRLHAGDEVTLTATHTLGTATATQRVAHTVSISIADITTQPFTNPGDPVSLAMLNNVESALLVSINIDDPADEHNDNRLTMDYTGSYQITWDDDIYHTPTPLSESGKRGWTTVTETFYPHYLLTESSTRLLIDSESASQLLGTLLYMSSTNSFIFTDEQLRGNGGKPTIDLLMLMESPRRNGNMYDPEQGWFDDDMWDDGDYITPSDTVSQATYHCRFQLETFSEDYFKYLQTVTSYETLGGTFVGEPTPIHNNIRGGLGIVGSYATAPWVGDSVPHRLKTEE